MKNRTLKLLALIFLLIYSTTHVVGQKYGNVWQFSTNIGIDFNGCTPTLISGKNKGFEGCAAVSDSNGNLLCYTNSDSVWNRLGNVMPNGYLLNSGGTLSQTIIVKKPQSSTIYYLITTQIQAGGFLSLQYHTIDMSLNGGLGDVINKNNVMSALVVTEQVAATYHSNGSDIWIMTHQYGTNLFMAYLINSSGISNTPVLSFEGPAHKPCISNINARGEIKFSPNGEKLAFTANGVGGNDSSNIIALFDFDNNTGLVSNGINLPFSRGEFGLTFSPDNSKLYGSTWKAFGFGVADKNFLYQFDLSSGVASQIVNSKVIIDSSAPPYGTLKIGPDGKIYVRQRNNNYLGIINSPNLAGLACSFNDSGFFVGNNNGYGLNNYIEYENYNTLLTSLPTINDTSICAGDSVFISLDKFKLVSLSPTVSFSCNIDSTNLYVKPNATSVYTLVAKDSCGNIDTTTFEIKVEAIPVAVFAFTKTSFDITDVNISIINQSLNATSYEWYFNGQLLSTSSNPLFPIVDTGLYCFKLVAKNTIGCSDTFDLCVNVVDTVVSNIVDQVSVYVPNAFSPNGDGKNDLFKPIFSGDVSSLRYKFAIYNRYGQQVFYTNNYQEGWNGTFQKMKCDLGYFYYYLQLGQNNLKGDVLLLR